MQNKQGFKSVTELIEDFKNGEMKFNEKLEKTNFYFIDQIANGMQKGQLVVLGGRTGTGKTALALNIIDNIAINTNDDNGIFLYFSLEMTNAELVNRLMSKNMHAPISSIYQWRYKLRTKQLSPEQENEFSKLLEKCRRGNLWIIDETYNLEQIVQVIKNFVNQNIKINGICIDHLQILRTEIKSKSKYDQIAHITQILKEEAKKLNINIFLLSQLSRESAKNKKQEPDLYDLRESGTIEQDSDVVFLIYNNGENENGERFLNVKIAKNRNGKSGDVFPLLFMPRINKFLEPIGKDLNGNN
ncbi:DnaB-like helicase C-terminal domain-containing protein [Mycoplasmopsis pullorum]|uniref:SF4 helicase domain-containing protein n=1 Tax=Mycoplasmopsis pullorum TaxID=48003 RepID=A0A1L4FSB4_9BACT|nr:DnaB-like helicase C-terminal domain-containing protein [Mycoplasmopsis pullorum]APJ38511.1 hypothetical protein BLA55_02475 [Mycoplasmopsis pullorum]